MGPQARARLPPPWSQPTSATPSPRYKRGLVSGYIHTSRCVRLWLCGAARATMATPAVCTCCAACDSDSSG
eukprot:2261687-Rhodomonas_salina.1